MEKAKGERFKNLPTDTQTALSEMAESLFNSGRTNPASLIEHWCIRRGVTNKIDIQRAVSTYSGHVTQILKSLQAAELADKQAFDAEVKLVTEELSFNRSPKTLAEEELEARRGEGYTEYIDGEAVYIPHVSSPSTEYESVPKKTKPPIKIPSDEEVF